MKNRKLARMLVDLDYYSIVYDEQPTDEDMTILNDNKIPRKVTDNGISDNDLALMLQAEQTLHLKSIKRMMIFFVILAIIGLCAGLYFLVDMYIKFNTIYY